MISQNYATGENNISYDWTSLYTHLRKLSAIEKLFNYASEKMANFSQTRDNSTLNCPTDAASGTFYSLIYRIYHLPIEGYRNKMR